MLQPPTSLCYRDVGNSSCILHKKDWMNPFLFVFVKCMSCLLQLQENLLQQNSEFLVSNSEPAKNFLARPFFRNGNFGILLLQEKIGCGRRQCLLPPASCTIPYKFYTRRTMCPISAANSEATTRDSSRKGIRHR